MTGLGNHQELVYLVAHYNDLYLSGPGLGAGFMRGVGSLEWQRLANNQASNKVVMVTKTPITLQFFGNILAVLVQVLAVCQTVLDRTLTKSMTFCHF